VLCVTHPYHLSLYAEQTQVLTNMEHVTVHSHAVTKRCRKPMYFVISSTQAWWYRFLRLYKLLLCHVFETEEEEDCLTSTFRYIQELYTDFVINTLRTGHLNCLNPRSRALNTVIQLLYFVSLKIHNKFADD
jgi:hypothetical protein